MATNETAWHPVRLLGLGGRLSLGAELVAVLASLGLVVAITAGLVVAGRFMALPHVSIVYLVPVLIAATRWGPIPAVAAAIGGIIASAFFFYPPLYDLRVSDPQQMMELTLFILVAIVTGHLADSARAHMTAAQKNEGEMRSLYAFSRRLAVASTAEEILAAARDHMSAVVGRPVVLLQVHTAGAGASGGADGVPDAVRTHAARAAAGDAMMCVDEGTRSTWLVRTVSRANAALGCVAVDFGRSPAGELQSLGAQVNAALTDASATLERLDVGRALDEARARSNRETFREAVIGSVSHELRSPLAAILGAASVLSRTQTASGGDERISDLAEIIRVEAERLDSDIQKLLDAGRISGDGLRPRPTWTDPADLINAALEPYRARSGGRQIEAAVSDELPLVFVDPIFIQQALRQVIDNALKYSAAGSSVDVAARDLGGHTVIEVRDSGMGITAEESERLFERFYRGARHQAVAPGSGLGLWIARAFVTASGGELEIASPGRDQGTAVSIRLPAGPAGQDAEQDGC